MASNRDEYLARPTAKAEFWEPPNEQVLAGRDLEKHPTDDITNGTWLGITRQGKLGALTNYREPNFRGNISRGALVRDFLWNDSTVYKGLEATKEHASDYGGFNLIYFHFHRDTTEMAYFTNRDEDAITDLKGGVVYGLSNSTLFQPWPKVEEGKELFENIIAEQSEDEDVLVKSLFDMLSTSKPFTDPDDVEILFDEMKERIFCPRFSFHTNPDDDRDTAYGTRSSTIILIDNDNRVTYVERNWHDENHETFTEHDDVIYKFDLEV